MHSPSSPPAGRLTVLASGSAGNATLLEADGFGLLIDCGLGPQELAARLAAVGASWAAVSAVLLTHTHGDHWNAYTLAHLRRLHIPLIAHPRHHNALACRRDYTPLHRAGLTRPFQAGERLALAPGLTCLPVQVPHDSDPTFAFRFESAPGPDGWSVGFASDVGFPRDDLADALAGVDVLAVEYNHDVGMQRQSRRPRILIDRVLGNYGHLSNAQAAELTARVAAGGRLRAVVQLHLSRECNLPELAEAAGRAAAPGVDLVTAGQFEPSRPIPLAPRPAPARRAVQPALPGLGPVPA